jgi:hypothetical protein
MSYHPGLYQKEPQSNSRNPKNGAKIVKICASILMVLSIPGCGFCVESGSHWVALWVAIFFVGFFGFVVGRFME